MRRTYFLFAAAIMIVVASVGAGQQPVQGQGRGQGQQGPGRGGNQQQARERVAQTPQGTATIAGRVLTADTGRPVKRARVTVAGGGRGSHAAVTDDQGRYVVTNLAGATYTVTASRTGFVDAAYGQRRPLQPGTPLTLGDGQAA